MSYVTFDIGGTKTRVAVSDDLKTFTKVESFKTPAKPEEGIKKIVAQVQAMTDTVDGMAGGLRGRLNEEKTGIENDNALAKWAGYNVAEALEKKLKCEVYIENDSAIAALGEAIFGAGKGMDIVAYHTVSTGVGGARVDHGEIDHTTAGFEPGHQILDIDRTILGDEITPTLENMVSGTAVGERFGCKAYEIPQSDMLWDELAGYLGQGLRNTILYWSPDAIVLGGSMIIGDPRIEMDPIRKATVEALDGFVDAPLIAIAKLGDEAGLYGGLALLQQKPKIT